MRHAIIAALFLLTGCAGTAEHIKGPREIIGRVEQPACTFICTITVTVTDSEGARVAGGVGAVTITKPITTTTSVTESNEVGVPTPPGVPK
jgi:hypothetical protein